MEEKIKNHKAENNLAFVKEVAKYFMDFLETDFHKRRNPKRSIKLKNPDNLLVGLNLNKYPSFIITMWKSINHSFHSNYNKINIKKNEYKAKIPTNLLDLIKLQVNKINDEVINEVVNNISEEIQKASTLYKKEYDRAVLYSIENIEKIFKKELVLSFIKSIEKSIENLSLGDENSIYLMEEELTDIMVNLTKNKVSEIIKVLLSDEKIDIKAELRLILNIEDIKINVIKFFENFKVADLFSEIYELERNRQILDKQEFYLYFCDITFNRAKYPIFYIPFTIEKDSESLIINFDYQVYINKKALEYIVQEYNIEKGKKGSLTTIKDRIIYPANHRDDFKELISSIIREIVNIFELDFDININSPNSQISRSFLVRISNACYISLFDKADEALINDYEEILQLLTSEDHEIASAFGQLIDDFIYKNPKPFESKIADEWDEAYTSDKLIYKTPIPLNSEQRQIMSAVNKNDCKYIAVEGPPGTGKSHTITAIVFDAILKEQSTLVLSDKKEALDVVEDKITQAMNKVRIDRTFQNPLLRLGRTGSTYNQILAKSTLENIRTHYRAIKGEYEQLEKNIFKTTNALKEDIDAEISAYGEINIEEIHELLDLENYYKEHGCAIDIEEFIKTDDSSIEIEEFKNIFYKLKELLSFDNRAEIKFIFQIFNKALSDFSDACDFKKFIEFIDSVLDNANKTLEVYKSKVNSLQSLGKLSDDCLENLRNMINEYENLKLRMFGYLFSRKKVKCLNQKFNNVFLDTRIENPHKKLEYLRECMEILDYVRGLKQEEKWAKYYKDIDYLAVIESLTFKENVRKSVKEIITLKEDLQYLIDNFKKYPQSLKKLKIDTDRFETFLDNELLDISELGFERLIRFINLSQKIREDFKRVPLINYTTQKKDIEDLVTTQMTYLMDESVVNFYEQNKATAKALRDIIRGKKRFPKKEFAVLRKAFPCILAGIRDYAEYIPLEPEMFDLVIIDEASQVSIAQAFPALLRAKKVIIFGDRKQFSNVKAAHARSDTNRQYRNNLRETFLKYISTEPTELVKLEKFNIKTSILEFFEFINNYNIQLLKHFRGYKELISYSNEYFYRNLEVMKIRGKSIEDVLKISIIEHDGKEEIIPNTNKLEIEFIISEIQKLIESNNKNSIGIITPHTNQQKLLVEEINKLPEREYILSDLNLKIMTFDTCQGEERDIVFYSMVATKENDHLWGVFIKDLSSVDIEDEGKIKAQRLNVGFSRVKECMHIVLSKPIDEYTGSIGEAIRHYVNVLEEAKKEKPIDSVDRKSQKEPEVLNWFYQTEFWKENKNKIEFIPQFEIGKYLKQLDKTYHHPKYVVDFLLIFKDENHNEHKIIIEYDGFDEHFKDFEEINEHTYQHYYSDDDVYRQKVLEGYGYKFLRINKFNAGDNPIKTLNDRIDNLISHAKFTNVTIDKLKRKVEGLHNGNMKECIKCKTIKEVDAFKDDSLITGYGKICNDCKKKLWRKHKKPEIELSEHYIDKRLCPLCGSSMKLRTGRYGKFHGCSNYPYCRGTRQYKRS